MDQFEDDDAAVTVDTEAIRLGGGSERRVLLQSNTVVVPVSITVPGTSSSEEAAEEAAQALGAGQNEELDTSMLHDALPSDLEVAWATVSYAAMEEKEEEAGWLCTLSLGHLLATALAAAHHAWLA